MSTAVASQIVPTGTWRADYVHSTVEFSVRHMVVSTFRGFLTDFDVELISDESGLRLEGTGRVESVVTRDDNLNAHMRSPDFLDVARYPEVSFRAERIAIEGDLVTAHGQVTIKGVTRPIELHGRFSGPIETPLGDRIGLELEGFVDRRDFGIDWSAALPGGGLVVGNQVRLAAQLELGRE